MINNIDYQVQLVPLGHKTKEAVVLNEDDSYTIFIEASLSSIEQRKAFLHAMKHICNNDFTKKCSADLIEINAHGA